MNCPPESASHASPALNLRRATASASVGGRVGVGGAEGCSSCCRVYRNLGPAITPWGAIQSVQDLRNCSREHNSKWHVRKPKTSQAGEGECCVSVCPQEAASLRKTDKKINPNHSNRNDQCDYCEHKYYDCYFTLFVSTLTLLRGRVS